jgi:hypothetical protein
MSVWKLTPQVRDNVAELQYWGKNSSNLIRKEMFATATFICQSDTRPEIDLVNSTGIELINGTAYAWSLTELESIPKGPWVTWIFPDSMPDNEKAAIQNLIDIGMYSSLESTGWVHQRIEYFVTGPLTLVEIEE